MCVCVCVCVCERERERESVTVAASSKLTADSVPSHVGNTLPPESFRDRFMHFISPMYFHNVPMPSKIVSPQSLNKPLQTLLFSFFSSCLYSILYSGILYLRGVNILCSSECYLLLSNI